MNEDYTTTPPGLEEPAPGARILVLDVDRDYQNVTWSVASVTVDEDGDVVLTLSGDDS